MLELSPDELLTTTRGVRRRLDVARPVPDELITQCVACALQAPAGSNVVRWRFVIVRDLERRRAVGEIYRDIYENTYMASPGYIGGVQRASAAEAAQQLRTARSADALAENMGRAPALVIACLVGRRLEGTHPIEFVSLLGGVMPAIWSFMLAARARGLGTCWTSMHLVREREVADLLEIPFDSVQQVCMTPLAYTLGVDFRPALRPAPAEVIHWDVWQAEKPPPPSATVLEVG